MSKYRNPTAMPAAGLLRLMLAFLGSLAFHAFVFGAGSLLLLRPKASAKPTPTPLQAILVQPAPQPAPTLIAPESPPEPPAAATPPPPPPPRAARGRHPANVSTVAARQIAEHLFYPPEAVAQGLEGEAEVMLFLDEAGNAVAARLERSSGHAILDDAAVKAARAVRALPEGAPREVLLPVRFRLR